MLAVLTVVFVLARLAGDPVEIMMPAEATGAVHVVPSRPYTVAEKEESMLKRSHIVAAEEDLQAFYRELEVHSLAALWRQGEGAAAPKSQAVPFVWHWRDVRPQAMRAAELVGTAQAERRVLLLANPGLPFRAATNTLTANIQVVMPGEIARAHRHTAAALRLIIESQGGYTVVNGHRIPMLPGDLVLTPNWTWHDHANDSDSPMIWLDGLDSPLVRMLECGFREEYEAESQSVAAAADPSFAKYGTGGLRPAWEPTPTAPYSPLWHYPYTQARQALERLAAEGTASPCDGVIMEYTNPVTGGPAMPTIGCYVQMLRPGEHTQAHRRTANAAFHVVEGAGYSVVAGQRLDWEDKDVFCVPSWAFYEHVNTSDQPAILFSHTDVPLMRSLALYREEAHPEGRQ
jgi:gentisate 1,2-dioxygenase